MAEGPHTPATDSLFRLKACPGCDYSLETLPTEGTCPECGRRYDQRFVVLTGSGRGLYDNAAGGTWRGMAGQSAWILIIVWIFAAGRRGMTDPQLVGWGIIGAVALATQLYARLFSAREPRMQLWLSPDGVAQVASTPEARRAQWVTENASWLFTLVMCVGLLFAVVRRPGAVTLILGVSAMFVGAATVWWLRRRSTRGWDAAGDAPRLQPWGAVEKIEVNVLPKGRARVRCQVMRRWGSVAVNKLWVVDIEIGCTAGEAEGLRRQMQLWAGRPDEEE